MPWNTVSGSRTTNGEGFFPSFYLSLVCFPKQFEKTTNRTHDIVECDVYVHGGVVTLLDIPSGGKKWLKSFKHLRRGMAYNL